jgi:hypothetical protein
MKFNKWTVALTTAGVVSFASVATADESPVNSLISGTILSGYVDTSVVWNFDSGTTTANRFVNTGANRQDGFNLNVVQVGLEKALDEGTWSAGYKAEMWFGPDAAGLPGRLGGGTDAAIKQAYVALRAPVGNGLDFKIGQFDTIIGYEVASSYANPNFSRSYGFALEPLSHTGVLATYQVADWLGVAGGVANKGAFANGTMVAGNNVTGPFGQPASESLKSFMGGITLKAPESWGFLAGSSLYAGVVDGGQDFGLDDTINLYAGASVSTPVEGLTVGASYDYLANGMGNDTYGNALAGYVSYQITEQFKANVRGEFANSSGGYFTAPAVGYTANDEELWAATVTLDYALWKNVISRVEFRWDHADGPAFDGDEDDLSLLLNVIYKF